MRKAGLKLGEIILRGRKKKKLTQQQLADTLHVSVKTVSAWENDRRQPTIEVFLELVILLDLYRDFFQAPSFL